LLLRTFQIDGVVPIVPTPFQTDESIDFDSFTPLVDFAIAAQCSAICLPAYASEFYKLSDEERVEVVSQAVRVSDGRIPVIGQANHPSARLAARTARAMETAGADAIAIAVPRLFGSSEKDIFRYFDTVLSNISIPVLIQDFNPGGPTVSAQFVADLHRAHPHFRYIKLEEPLMSGKVKSILDRTGGAVGVLEGWGGMYLVELAEAGICGVMPGLAVSDLLARVYHMARSGRKEAAYEIFAGVLPQIVFSLQNMEFFHHAEKRLLLSRGILKPTAVRDLTMKPEQIEDAHIDFLNRRIIELLDKLGMPRNPVLSSKPV